MTPSHDLIISFNQRMYYIFTQGNYFNIRLNDIFDLCWERLPWSLETRACQENRQYEKNNIKVLTVSYYFVLLLLMSSTLMCPFNNGKRKSVVSVKVQWLHSTQFILIIAPIQPINQQFKIKLTNFTEMTTRSLLHL